LTTRDAIDLLGLAADDRVDRILAANLAILPFVGGDWCEGAFRTGVGVDPAGRFIGPGVLEGMLGGVVDRVHVAALERVRCASESQQREQ
jgi:hypothetical protein